MAPIEKETQQKISKVLYLEEIEKAFVEANAKWIVLPNADLDIGFYSKGRNRVLTTVNLPGAANCVGICLLREGESAALLETRTKTAEQQVRTYYPQIKEFTILTGTPEVINEFLQNKMSETEEQEVLPQEIIGMPESIVYERPVEYVNQLLARTEGLLGLYESRRVLDRYKIGVSTKGRLSFFFHDQEAAHSDEPLGPRLVNVKNVRIGKLKTVMDQRRKDPEKMILTEEVILPEALIAGIYIPDVEQITNEIIVDNPKIKEKPELLRTEIKRRAYITAEYIRRSLVPQVRLGLENTQNFYIAVAFEGQLNVWERHGFLTDIPPIIKGAVSPSVVLDVLAADQGFRNVDIKYRTRTGIVPLDVIFYKRNENGFAMLNSIPMWGYGKNLKNFTPYNNVVGLISVPDDMKFSERKKLSRRLEKTLIPFWSPGIGDIKVLTVDQKLLEQWRNFGIIPPKEEEIVDPEMVAHRSPDYGFFPTGGELKSAHFVMFESKQMIGGNQFALTLNYPGNTQRAVLIDWGWPFATDQNISQFPNRKSYAMGFNVYLEQGILPSLPRLYREDLLIQSLNEVVLRRISRNEDSYVVRELYHRKGWHDFVETLHQEGISKGFQVRDFVSEDYHAKLEAFENKFYTQKIIYDAIVMTHGHQDHDGAVSMIRDEVPAAMSYETWAFETARYRTGWHWSVQEAIYRKMRELDRIGNHYEVYSRPTHLFYDGQSMQLSPTINLTMPHVDHSIYGATAPVIRVMDSLGRTEFTIGISGDLKSGPHTERAIPILQQVNVLGIEGTNTQEEDKKPSTWFTEEIVRANMRKLREDADRERKAMIVQIPPNHIERLDSIAEGRGNRVVTVPLALAQVLHQFAIMNERLPWDKRVDVPVLGRDIVIQRPVKMTFDPWEEQLMHQYPVVSINTILASPLDYVVVATPYDRIVNILGGAWPKFDGMVVRSSYWPYQAEDKMRVIADYRDTRKHNWKYYADIDLSRGTVLWPKRENTIGLHASGHATESQLLDLIAAIADGGNLRLVIPFHTITRGAYAAKIQRYLDQKGLAVDPNKIQVITRVGKNGYAIPIPL